MKAILENKKTIINTLIVLFFFIFLLSIADLDNLRETMFKPDLIQDQFPKIITQAAKNTLIFTISGFAGGSFLGLLLALLKLSSVRFYRIISSAYIDIIRGLPAILILIFIAYGIPIAFGIRIPGDYSKGILALSIVSSAYIAEVIRSGINTTFQDFGRKNLYHIGIPFSGVMDSRNFVLANSIAGNKENTPVIA